MLVCWRAMVLAADVARSLEEGRGGRAAGAVAAAWGAVAARSLARPLLFPADARVVVVGGSTLGGSGKTPLAIACALHLAEAGHRVAFVGHAYRARPGVARLVDRREAVASVGDEALVAASALAAHGVAVVVGPTRQAALDLALAGARVVVVDGVAQLRPEPAHLALLAVDGGHPWGSGACPPRGDLRAPRAAVLSHCDRVVAVGVDGGRADEVTTEERPLDHARVVCEGAWLEGRRLSWEELRTRRVGLWTSIARPRRVRDQLVAMGVVPVLVAAHADHADVSRRDARSIGRHAHDAGVDLWICTAKCAVRLEAQGTQDALGPVPVATLEHALCLGDALKVALGEAVSGAVGAAVRGSGRASLHAPPRSGSRAPRPWARPST